ncbi:hypothetical protein OG613_47300 (plasmid) [Streptomyces sp. NBC_00015]|uniref:hypothetical protein n=1 Tax=Streptomyces sp. NBC_00015 TaxID=2903611 RepID=UPI002F9164A9
MLKCLCTGERATSPDRITPAERAMAEAEGLDPEYVHAFMDVWEKHADRVLSDPEHPVNKLSAQVFKRPTTERARLGCADGRLNENMP